MPSLLAVHKATIVQDGIPIFSMKFGPKKVFFFFLLLDI